MPHRAEKLVQSHTYQAELNLIIYKVLLSTLYYIFFGLHMMALCISLYFHDTISGGCITDGWLGGIENLTITDTFFSDLLVTKLELVYTYERR